MDREDFAHPALDRRELLKGAATTVAAVLPFSAPVPAAAAEGEPARPQRTTFRIHPAMGLSRVGNSAAFYLAPETAAGELATTGEALWGGLPLDPSSGAPLDADGFRDAEGRLKRQATRYRIYAYTEAGWPTGEGQEIVLGSVVDGRTVKDIVWTVHVANKKLNNFSHNSGAEEVNLSFYRDGRTPPVRRPGDGPLDSEKRLATLVIDPGPRALSARADAGKVAAFDRTTPASFAKPDGTVAVAADYPKSFPADHFTLDVPLRPIDSLGDIRIEAETGRLIFAPGFGNTVGIMVDGKVPSLEGSPIFIEHDQWFDDVSDGPVDATLVFEDGSVETVAGAWALAGAPGFAPQVRNVVTVWDDVYDVFVRELGLVPELHDGRGYMPGFRPVFEDDIRPLFQAVKLLRWNIHLPRYAVMAHDAIGDIKPADDPTAKLPNFKSLIRNPFVPSQDSIGQPLMPLSLGSAGKPFLSITPTQYFMLHQWHGKLLAENPRRPLGPGETLDRVTLVNGVAGRMNPGLQYPFVILDTHLFRRDWRTAGCGPFRINAATLDYAAARKDRPFLGVGYVPLRDAPVEPGDLTKFMAVPWLTDFNQCTIHPPFPNPNGDKTLYWSWPAERPFVVHPQSLSHFDAERGWTPGQQVYAVRGAGTTTHYPALEGRFQVQRAFVLNWYKVGFVVQASRIDPAARPASADDPFLEVASFFETSPDQTVAEWPSFNVPPAP
ncbi:hypothetical protein SAMN02745172_03279 [Pseudoxanthobacter soli DSM 19599]|uniref:L-lysine 6-oxidase n=1 Tax=Pseudoxanthobacter soli DSM 19599 TaxID=1123029 RepID=A0A1M7ZNW3_9HYPH|nr:LodA/GoxA family CTQ-dependent oxidase [Pseudoxanthobacter soli]SHO66620.1 hypothetical protein SAMN02745172_03279 [Pseudoxanthobacter soli DSM 19599]